MTPCKGLTAYTGVQNTELGYMNIQWQLFLYQNNNKNITPQMLHHYYLHVYSHLVHDT